MRMLGKTEQRMECVDVRLAAEAEPRIHFEAVRRGLAVDVANLREVRQ